MRGAKSVIFAFSTFGKTGKTAARAKRSNAVTASRQDLVGIGLVADVPDDLVAWRVEHVVQCNRQLDDAETRAQMTAGHSDRVDGLCAQLVCYLLEF